MERANEKVSPKFMTSEELIIHFHPTVKKIAYKYLRAYNTVTDIDDLISVGNIGLLDAITKYDPQKNNLFKTYAEYRIRGAILDELRKHDCISKHYRDEIKVLEKFCQETIRSKDRKPTDNEICHGMNISEEKLQKLYIAKSTKIERQEKNVVETKYGHLNSPEQHLKDSEIKEKVNQKIKTLSPKEQSILFLKYHRDFSFNEIGELLQLSNSRISQIHSNIVKLLEISFCDMEGQLLAA